MSIVYKVRVETWFLTKLGQLPVILLNVPGVNMAITNHIRQSPIMNVFTKSTCVQEDCKCSNWNIYDFGSRLPRLLRSPLQTHKLSEGSDPIH